MGSRFLGICKCRERESKRNTNYSTFKLPESYKVKERVQWTKVWRQSGFLNETIKLEGHTELPARSKAVSYLKSIRYEYVPAIKGPDYFEKLLSSVHDMLETTVQESIRNASASFTGTIQEHTSGILEDLNLQLGLASGLTLPTDLRQLFSALEFRSQSGAHSVGLSQRGDGIKVRHIPIILHWMARQANHKSVAVAGRPRVESIWGYEEPENNLEARSAFELAEYFLKCRDEGVQVFITTHSPIFYSELLRPERDNVSLGEVRQSEGAGSLIIAREPERSEDIEAIDGSVGFLQLIQPHIKDWKKRVDELKSQICQLVDTTRKTIFVEGPTDKLILETLLKQRQLSEPVQVSCSEQSGGGHTWVKDRLLAWHYSRPQVLAVGLFDYDKAADASYDSVKKDIIDASNGRTRVRAVRVPRAGLAQEIIRHKIPLDVAIEEICPREMWIHAKDNEWCEDRPNLIHIYPYHRTDQTFDDWLSERIPDDLLRFVAKSRIKSENKEKFSKLVAKHIRESSSYDFDPLNRLLDALLEKLGLNQD